MANPWLTLLGYALGGPFGALAANSVAKLLEQQIAAWNQLSDEQKVALLRHMQNLPGAQRSTLGSSYMPIREQMASMAAQNGIDPGFLYR